MDNNEACDDYRCQPPLASSDVQHLEASRLPDEHFEVFDQEKDDVPACVAPPCRVCLYQETKIWRNNHNITISLSIIEDERYYNRNSRFACIYSTKEG
jgi:hypothetical protein